MLLKTNTFRSSTIPVLTMRDYYRNRPVFVQSLSRAFQEIGFVGIIDTNVKSNMLSQVYSVAKTFFALERDKKEEISGSKIGGERGYTGTSESPVGRHIKIRDCKEFIHFGRKESHLGYPKNMWSRYVPMRQPVLQLYQNLSQLVLPLASALEEATDVSNQALQKMVKEGDHLLRLVRYPGELAQGVEGAAPHIDSNLFTILPPATSKGLEVFINNVWVPVKVPSDAVVVNSGSMLEHLTNGYFRSVLHRVIKYENGGPDRYSAAFFVHSRENDAMTPLKSCILKTGGMQKYPEATRQYLLYQRLFAMGRTTPSMTAKFMEWGDIQRWKSFITKNDPRTVLVEELNKVSSLLTSQNQFH